MDTLLVGNYTGDNVTIYDLSGGLVQTINSSYINQIEYAIVDSIGNIYINNQYDPSGFIIIKFDSSGNNPQVILTELNAVLQGFTIDKFDKLYVGRGNGVNTVTKYTTSGILLLTISDDGVNQPDGIEIDSSGYIYVANFAQDNSGNYLLTKYDSSGIQITTGGFPINIGFRAFDLALDSLRNIYVSLTNEPSITKYTPLGIEITTGGFPISLSYESAGIVLDLSGNIYVNDYQDSKTHKYSPLGIEQIGGGFPITNGLNNPAGLFFKAACFNKGAKILCLLNNEEVYIPIENIKPGTIVRSYLHGDIPVKLIGSGFMKNDPSDVNNCMYTNKDLTVTGGHSILVDKLPNNVIKQTKQQLKRNWKIDNKFMFLAHLNKDFIQHKDNSVYEYFHISLESDTCDKRYGIWANGVLTESISHNQFSKLF